MIRSIVCLLLLGVAILPLNTKAAQNIALSTAQSLAKDKNFLDALKIVSPCLKAERKDEISNLEECLYIGEDIAIDAVKVLEKKAFEYEKKLYDEKKGPFNLDEWQEATPYRNLGLNLKWGHYSSLDYGQTFLKKLRGTFPKSKYRDEYQYRLIQSNISGVKGWENWEKTLQDYLKEFPSGKFEMAAKLDLAHIYDNLWDLIRPDSKTGYHQYFSSNNTVADQNRSEQYRQKSLKLYREVLKKGETPNISRKTLEEISKRMEELKSKKAGYIFYILND